MGGYAFFLLDPIPEWVKNILVSNFLPGHRRTVLPDLYEAHTGKSTQKKLPFKKHSMGLIPPA